MSSTLILTSYNFSKARATETVLVILSGLDIRIGSWEPFEIFLFRCNYEGTLKDLLIYQQRPKQVKRIYYQRLSIPINELENKRQFKCLWCADPPNGEEKELVLYPNRLVPSPRTWYFIITPSVPPQERHRHRRVHRGQGQRPAGRGGGRREREAAAGGDHQ